MQHLFPQCKPPEKRKMMKDAVASTGPQVSRVESEPFGIYLAIKIIPSPFPGKAKVLGEGGKFGLAPTAWCFALLWLPVDHSVASKINMINMRLVPDWSRANLLSVDKCLSSCQATNFVLPLSHVSPCHFDRADCGLHLANSGVDFSLDHLFGSNHIATLAVINHES